MSFLTNRLALSLKVKRIHEPTQLTGISKTEIPACPYKAELFLLPDGHDSIPMTAVIISKITGDLPGFPLHGSEICHSYKTLLSLIQTSTNREGDRFTFWFRCTRSTHATWEKIFYRWHTIRLGNCVWLVNQRKVYSPTTSLGIISLSSFPSSRFQHQQLVNSFLGY